MGIVYEKTSEPSPRDSHILLSFENSILLFGGSSGNARSDFFEFSIDEGKWKSIVQNKGSRPSSRFCHVGIVVKRRMYIFGGYDGENRLNDFHMFILADEITSQTNIQSLKQDLNSFVGNDMFADVEIVVKGVPNMTLPAHKLMLSRCERFERLIDNAAEDSEGRVRIDIDDMNYETAVQLVRYLYTDECDIELDNSI